MIEKIILTDKEYENLAKGLAIGVSIGTIVGAIINLAAFCFTLGGVIGIIGSVIYSRINKKKYVG